jgi:predicted nucleotidyltransferase component of viral defense system
MARFRNDPEFAAGITEAASRLGLARPFVEKDYWVTQVLRALHLVFPGQFLLMGGTSLSKGYGIIDRFSEDTDVLVVPRNDHSATTAEARLRAMVTGTAAALDLPWEESRTPGRGLFPAGAT